MTTQDFFHKQFLDRKAFTELPVEERRKILEEQAKALQKHYDELAKREHPGGGDFVDYLSSLRPQS